MVPLAKSKRRFEILRMFLLARSTRNRGHSAIAIVSAGGDAGKDEPGGGRLGRVPARCASARSSRPNRCATVSVICVCDGVAGFKGLRQADCDQPGCVQIERLDGGSKANKRSECAGRAVSQSPNGERNWVRSEHARETGYYKRGPGSGECCIHELIDSGGSNASTHKLKPRASHGLVRRVQKIYRCRIAVIRDSGWKRGKRATG